MKNYIKPTFTLAGLAPVALAAGGCDITMSNENIASLFELFEITDTSKAFMESEGCIQALPDGIVEYCKFTLQDDGNGVIIGS